MNNSEVFKNTDDEYIERAKEYAKVLGISERYVYKLIKTGVIPIEKRKGGREPFRTNVASLSMLKNSIIGDNEGYLCGIKDISYYSGVSERQAKTWIKLDYPVDRPLGGTRDWLNEKNKVKCVSRVNSSIDWILKNKPKYLEAFIDRWNNDHSDNPVDIKNIVIDIK